MIRMTRMDQCNDEIEEWKLVEAFPNYAVSSLGRVRNMKSGKELKPRVENAGYLTVLLRHNGVAKGIKIHRLVANAFIDHIEGKQFVDHINGVRTDNRVQNLRWATKSENSHNRRKSRGTSKYKGVCWDKKSKQWRSKITVEGKSIIIGWFDSEEEAGKAYNQLAQIHFGSFALINEF